MPRTFTSDELVTSLRNLGVVPTAGSTGTAPTDLLKHLSDVLRSRILPEVMRVREEYNVASVRTSLVANTQKYRVPTRALGNKLRGIWWFDGTDRRDLTQIDPEDKHHYASTLTGDPLEYYFEGNHVVMVRTVAANGSLEFSFYFRPGELVAVSSARRITAVNLGTKQVTLDSTIVAGWDNADTFDVHSSHSGAEIKVWDAAATTVSGTGITFTAAIDGTTFGTLPVEVGDYVCLAGEAVVPAIPQEMHPVLVRATALQIAEVRGDKQQVAVHSAQYREDLKNALYLLDDRVDSDSRFLRQMGGSYSYGGA